MKPVLSALAVLVLAVPLLASAQWRPPSEAQRCPSK